MSCERCAESAASGAKACEFCGEPLDGPPVPETAVVHPPTASAAPAQAPGRLSPGMRALTFVAGFLLALFLMGVGAAVGGTNAGMIGGILGAFAGPVLMILMAKWNGDAPLAAGGVTAVAVVVIVFGGCLMLLSL